MASSLTDRAERRAAEVQAAIRALLAAGDSHAAFNRAIRALQGEAAKVRGRRRGAGALADAELAGSLAALAAQLHAHKPGKPPGCPAIPAAPHLLAVFEATYASGKDQT